MLRSISLALAALAWNSFALAETVETTSSISNGVARSDQAHDNDIEFEYRKMLRKKNSESIAAADALDRRLSGQARRAIGSICDRCFVSRDTIKISGLYRIANPNSDEMRIDDPAQAPVD